ncbi:MAG: type IV pilus assembly protein PilY1 [Motiliproteus sp.]|jgi:type IV pilus assembly protein PilY1
MRRSVWLSLMFSAQAFTAATAGTVSQSPLFLATSAKPNIMLLIDNSGSMSNIVPEAPYDPKALYHCPVTLHQPTANPIEIRIDANGVPFFNDGIADVDWVNLGVSGRCFDPAASYRAKLYATDGISPAGYLPAEYSGHYLNWYFGSDITGTTYPLAGASPDWGTGTIRIKPGTLRRMDIAQTAADSLVDSLDNTRIGLAAYDVGGAGADIKISVASADTAAAKTALKTAIAALTPTGSTPLAEALHEVGRYFIGTTGAINSGHQPNPSCVANGQYDGSLTLHPTEASVMSLDDDSLFNRSPGDFESPVCHFCQKNFVILLTDGRPEGDQDITADTGLQDYDGDCSGCVDDRKAARTYESNGSDYLDDVAQALFEIDLRPDIDDLDGNEVVNNLSTYTIGFADDQVINDPLMQDTADQGGGLFLQASNASQLLTSLKTAVSDIQAQLGSASAVTTSSTQLSTSTIVFQALFNSADWSGQVNALPIHNSGQVGSVVWNAADNMPVSSVTRNVLAWDPVAAAGISFDTGNAAAINTLVASAGATSLSAAQIDYLRGDVSNALPEGTLRSRTATAGRVPLGDIINSDPLFVKQQNFSYGRLIEAEGSEYDTFRQSSAYLSRPGMLYVGGNDGMLHGFSFTYNAGSGIATGSEQFAYIPNAVFGKLGALTDPNYTHHYYVDGSPVFGDAYLDTDANGADDSWRTVLVGTTGAGGKGVFALDITDPANVTAADILWDLDSTQSDFSDLGVQLGEASIARMPDGHFYAVFGNGYGSALGKAMLYLVRLDDPTRVVSIELDTAGGNGLSSPLVVDHDRDLTADLIYAGDLKGNLWKVNLGVSGGVLTLSSAFSQAGSLKPLFIAEDAASPAGVQPISAQPEAGIHPDGGLMIYFGTGQYFEVGDADVASPQTQTFYGIRDDLKDNNGSKVDRGQLVAQTIDAEDSTTFSGFKVRLTSSNAVNYSNKQGWYMDLGLYHSATDTTATVGERVVNQPILRGDRLLFTTLIPSVDPCRFGGNSWLMEINAVTGGRLEDTPFDLNDDGLFTDADKVAIIDPSFGDTVLTSVSGLQKTNLGIFDTPAILEDGSKEVKVIGGSSAQVGSVRESKSSMGGRRSWQQLR